MNTHAFVTETRRQAEDIVSGKKPNAEQEALRHFIDGYPIGKRSRGRMALLCRRLHEQRVDANARAVLTSMDIQSIQSAYDLLDTDLSRSKARELALAAQVRGWKRRFYAGLAAGVALAALIFMA